MQTLLILELIGKSIREGGFAHDCMIAIACRDGAGYAPNATICEMVRMKNEGLFTVDSEGFIFLSQKGRESVAMATLLLDIYAPVNPSLN